MLENLMEKHKFPYHTISAKSGENVENLFFSVVDMINESQLQRQRKGKDVTNNEDESHGGPQTFKPLRGMDKDTEATEGKEG
jgi:hypothetical protein